MFGRLMPREGRFFEAFSALAERIVAASHELSTLMTHLDRAEGLADQIRKIEEEGDEITRACIDQLHRTFITPIDRDHIHQLITRMDDILDLIEDVAQSAHLYDVKIVTPEALQLTELCVKGAELVQKAVSMLSRMENATAIMEVCAQIDRMEADADHAMRAGIAKLFREEADVRQLIKLRTMYLLLEEVTDRCEDVANIIEGIVLENS